MVVAVVTLAALSAALTGFVITCGVWMRADRRELSEITDNLDGQRKLVAEYKHKYDTEFAAHTVTSKRFEQEQNLRAIAESQRNEAQQRCRTYLAQNLRGATKDEINAVLADLFSTPLALVPKPEEARRSDHPADGLVDPFG